MLQTKQNDPGPVWLKTLNLALGGRQPTYSGVFSPLSDFLCYMLIVMLYFVHIEDNVHNRFGGGNITCIKKIIK